MGNIDSSTAQFRLASWYKNLGRRMDYKYFTEIPKG